MSYKRRLKLLRVRIFVYPNVKMSNLQFANKKAGFTMLELTVVLAIIVLLAFLAISAFGRFRANALLDQTGAEIVTALSEARGKTLASKSADVYGVHFETAKVVRFKGASYSAIDANNEEFIFDPRVHIIDISIEGGDEVIFERLTGATTNKGTVTIEIVGDNTRRATTTVLSSGIIE